MRTRRWLLNTVAAAVLVTLGACGGGGGDDEPLGPTVDISTVNRESVAHAAVAGVWGLTLGVTAPLATGSPGAGQSMAAWLQMQSRRAASATQREGPMAVIGPIVEPCQVSGTMTVTWNDADNNATLSVGDVLTTVANNCQQVAGETTNGTMVITALSDTAGRVAMTQLSFDTPRHAMTLNGSVRLEDVSANTVQTTIEGPVAVAVTLKHLAPPFTDTVTLQNGFVAREALGNGETFSTFDGLLASTAAGGVVRLTTPTNTPVRQFDASDYPYTGALQITGRNGMLQMTVLSADQVRLDLDDDSNGSFESTSTVAWDWLL
jgi:hypothetical protein